jgi:hypothetical protein
MSFGVSPSVGDTERAPYFLKTRTNENTGAPWAYVFISRIIHARNHVKKTAKMLPEVF